MAPVAFPAAAGMFSALPIFGALVHGFAVFDLVTFYLASPWPDGLFSPFSFSI